MSHLNNSKFTVLPKTDSFSSLPEVNTVIVTNECMTSNREVESKKNQAQNCTGSQFQKPLNKTSKQLFPARYTLHRFGVEVTHFGIGDGLGWDLTSIHRDELLNLQSMILYPGDILELVQPEICIVPRKVDDFMESRKLFFQGKLLVCIANDHHLSVLYGIEKRTIQLARYYGDKLLSEPDGKILDECRWTVLGAVENIIRPYPNVQNNFTQTNISGKHWQVSLTIPSLLLENIQNEEHRNNAITFNRENISATQLIMLETIGELIENQFQSHAEMDNINALTSFVAKHIPQVQVTIQSHNGSEQRNPDSKSSLSTPIKISNNLADNTLGLRLKPIFLLEEPKYKNTMLSHYRRNRNRRRLEHAMEIRSRYLRSGNILQAKTITPPIFFFNEDQVYRLAEERMLKMESSRRERILDKEKRLSKIKHSQKISK